MLQHKTTILFLLLLTIGCETTTSLWGIGLYKEPIPESKTDEQTNNQSSIYQNENANNKQFVWKREGWAYPIIIIGTPITIIVDSYLLLRKAISQILWGGFKEELKKEIREEYGYEKMLELEYEENSKTAKSPEEEYEYEFEFEDDEQTLENQRRQEQIEEQRRKENPKYRKMMEEYEEEYERVLKEQQQSSSAEQR